MSATSDVLVTIPKIPGKKRRTPAMGGLPVAYENGKGFWVSNGTEWICLNEAGLRRWLVSHGVSREKDHMDPAILEIQMTKSVAYAGPLAGHKAGLHVICGTKVIVTNSPKLPEGDAAIPWPILKRLFLEAIGERQFLFQKAWLQRARQAIRNGTPLPGHMLVLCGDAESGKTLIQTIYTAAMGGRSASPYAYMTKRNDFNRQLFGAESLSFGDEIASYDMRARRNFGANIKQIVANNEQECHGKGKEAITLTPCWRVMMSCNREAHNLLVLPPWDDPGVAEKIQLHLVNRPALFDSKDWSLDREANWRRVLTELPGFLAEIDSFAVPEALRGGGRMGVEAFHHPDLLALMEEQSEELQLLEIIDTVLFSPQPIQDPDATEVVKRTSWQGAAATLESMRTTTLIPPRDVS